VLCPKDRKTPLTLDKLDAELSAYACQDCKGHWIPLKHYEEWQAQHPHLADPDPSRCREALTEDFVVSEYDAKAALCPECKHYLSRAKVSLSNPNHQSAAFYVERCPNCSGIWCDVGEWPLLTQLGWHGSIPLLFTPEWQARVRKYELEDQERLAIMDKLGDELAQQVFQLASILEKHPNGDFAVAYLMRRFEQ
jgi:Zn-finger nucleic acid-binding protein